MATTFSSEFESVRSRFPALRDAGEREIFFDNAAGAQVPDEVVEGVREHLVARNVQRGGRYARSREVDARISETRGLLAAFLNAESPDEIVFGLNSTSLIRMVAESLRPKLRPGDRVVVTELDHEANIGPWLRLESSGVTPLWWRVRGAQAVGGPRAVGGQQAALDPGDLSELLRSPGGPVRVVALPLASNATGGVVDVAAAARLAREAGALTFVDAVHFAPHGPVDARALGADFLAFSGYKIFGPHVGFLWGRGEAFRALEPAREFFIPAGAPHAFEGGTQVYEGLAGMAGALRYLASLGGESAEGRSGAGESGTTSSRSGAGEFNVTPNWSGLDETSTVPGDSELDVTITRSGTSSHAAPLRRAMSRIRHYETDLARAMLHALREIPHLRLLGQSDPDRAADRLPTFSFRIDGLAPAEIVHRLAAAGIHARDGHMYAPRLIEASGIDPATGVCRVSLCHYNTRSEIERFAEAIRTPAVGNVASER